MKKKTTAILMAAGMLLSAAAAFAAGSDNMDTPRPKVVARLRQVFYNIAVAHQVKACKAPNRLSFTLSWQEPSDDQADPAFYCDNNGWIPLAISGTEVKFNLAELNNTSFQDLISSRISASSFNTFYYHHLATKPATLNCVGMTVGGADGCDIEPAAARVQDSEIREALDQVNQSLGLKQTKLPASASKFNY